jgi:hypothetical protein
MCGELECGHEDCPGRVAAVFGGRLATLCEECFRARRDEWIRAKREAVALEEAACLMCDASPSRPSKDLGGNICDACFTHSATREERFSPSHKPEAPELLDAELNIFVGSRHAASLGEALAEAGVMRVLMLCPFLPPPPLPYLRLAVADSLEQDLTPFWETAVDYLRHGNVLIHCNAGISRTGAIAALWLMRQRGLVYDEAIVEARKARSQLYPNSAFVEQLRRFK